MKKKLCKEGIDETECDFFFCNLCKPLGFKHRFYQRQNRDKDEISPQISDEESIQLDESILGKFLDELSDEFKGRVYFVRKYETLVNSILQKLKKETVQLFLYYIYQTIVSNNMKSVDSSYYWRDAALIFLFWLIEYPGFTKIQKLFHISDSSANRITTFFLSIIDPFCDIFITPFCYEYRIALTGRQIEKSEMDKKYHLVTGFLDPTHVFK
jgi:hypothetical protein